MAAVCNWADIVDHHAGNAVYLPGSGSYHQQGVPISISSWEPPVSLGKAFGAQLAVLYIHSAHHYHGLLIRKTSFGYKLRAVGGNSEAPRMAGINVHRVKIAVFVLAGVLAAVGGLFDVFNNATANSNFGGGTGFRHHCCAIGGVSMSGGSGSFLA